MNLYFKRSLWLLVIAILSLPAFVQAATTLGSDLTTDGSLSVNGNVTLGDAAADTVLFTSDEIYFEGVTANDFETRVSIADPTADNIISLQNNSGALPLSSLGQSLFFNTTGNTNITLPTSGTMCTLAGTETLSNKTLTSPVINGGSLDGTVIGGTSTAAGSFTGLSSTGVTVLGNNSATVAVDSSDWDISTTGALTGVSFDANGSGNSLSNVESTDIVDGTIANGDLANSSLTVTAGNGLTGGGAIALGAAAAVDVASGNGGIVVGASDIALTIAGSADGLSATTSSGSGLQILSSGLALLQGCADTEVLKWNETTDVWACATDSDSSVELDDLIDSGTLLASSVDINGGTIDGTTIGGSSPAAGSFTALSSTGVTAIGNNSASVAINSDDWDISTTGALTGVSFDANGSGNSISNIESADIVNGTVANNDLENSSLTVSAGTGLTGGGLVSLGGAVSLQAALGTSIDTSEVDADTLTLADMADNLALDADLILESSSASSDFRLVIDNSSNGDVAAALQITTSGGGSSFATAIDLSDADISTAIAFGANDVTVGGATLAASEFAVLDAGVALSELIDSGTLTAGTVDINGGAIDGTTIGSSNTLTGAFTTLSSTGTTTLGNNSATAAINSSDWDISTSGDMTDIGSLSMDGNLTIGSSGTAISRHISTTASNVTSANITAASCATYATITVSGAAVGDTVVATPAPATNGVEDVELTWFAFISATDTVTIRACNIQGLFAINTDNTQSWRVDVWKH